MFKLIILFGIKKYIINYGYSKPLGYSNYYKSIHAEIVAIKKIKNLNINNIIIIIFKLKKEKCFYY